MNAHLMRKTLLLDRYIYTFFWDADSYMKNMYTYIQITRYSIFGIIRCRTRLALYM